MSIKAAFERLKSGNFGKCAVGHHRCLGNGNISILRLSARPHAPLCIECQEGLEEQQRQQH
ncbi:MAG: hypothetical protein GW939_01020 [Candidatus Magasanikbacteria bacterium]|nr:hypothetical protein [Candidatus Magasanikbacteria bacterium]NCS71864.1 hypothetical protein [Candidatus Magasanikbacteria bacterium]